jgi:hypothetical protein
MPSVSRPPSPYFDRPSLSGRAAALLIAIGISGLIVLMLLRLGNFASGPADRGSNPIVVQLLAEAKKAQKAKPQAKTAPPKSRVPIPPPIVKVPNTAKLNMLVLSHEDFAATDISRLSNHPADTPTDAQASASAGNDDSVGQGPNGERLYNAEWYRGQPTQAEMATYLPRNLRETGQAVIACRTIERFHVDDCQELGESPPGIGLARALRQASWQFLVRPPRIGGRPLVGAWVRIVYDYRYEEVKDRN